MEKERTEIEKRNGVIVLYRADTWSNTVEESSSVVSVLFLTIVCSINVV